MKSKKLRDGARGEECTLCIYPHCNSNTETVVFAHARCADKGMGIKSPDWWGVYACSNCHDVLDGRVKTFLSAEEVNKCLWRGIYLTFKRRTEQGLFYFK